MSVQPNDLQAVPDISSARKTQRGKQEVVKAKVAILAEDGVGPEVIAAALNVPRRMAKLYSHTFEPQEASW